MKSTENQVVRSVGKKEESGQARGGQNRIARAFVLQCLWIFPRSLTRPPPSFADSRYAKKNDITLEARIEVAMHVTFSRFTSQILQQWTHQIRNENQIHDPIDEEQRFVHFGLEQRYFIRSNKGREK